MCEKQFVNSANLVSFQSFVFSNYFKMKSTFQNELYFIWRQSTKLDQKLKTLAPF